MVSGRRRSWAPAADTQPAAGAMHIFYSFTFYIPRSFFISFELLQTGCGWRSCLYRNSCRGAQL